MIILAIVIGCLVGIIFGVNAPAISYIYSDYLAISIIAALDSGIWRNNSNFKRKL